MKGKTLAYLGVLVALAVIAYFVTTDKGEKTASYKLGDESFFTVDSAMVDRIEIKTKDGNLVLVKNSGKWEITEPFRYKTVSTLVENAVSNLKNFKLESLVSTNPAKHESFGFTDLEKAEITVFENGAVKGKFLLGNPSASNASYVKRPDSDNIYIADNVDRYVFVKPTLNDWRDKSIVSIPKESIQSMDFMLSSDQYSVSRDTSGAFLLGGDPLGKTFDGVLNIFQKMEASEFKDTTLAPETAFTDVVRINHGSTTELRFLKLNTSPVKYLMQVTGDTQVYMFDEGYVKNIFKTKSELSAD